MNYFSHFSPFSRFSYLPKTTTAILPKVNLFFFGDKTKNNKIYLFYFHNLFQNIPKNQLYKNSLKRLPQLSDHFCDPQSPICKPLHNAVMCGKRFTYLHTIKVRSRNGASGRWRSDDVMFFQKYFEILKKGHL